ncbi:MAG: cytochrome c-type biogenesis protein CcmH [Myxococcales bacterium]|nr:cytochrome c-type biogenesis protein CcmH [Myxococcales bacterium]
MRVLRVVALLLAAFLLWHAPAQAGDDHGAAAIPDATQAVPGERELLGRLVAPCCWNQTLDIHGGAAPDRLRAEIRARLTAGESAESIENDFVKRYGPQVRAQSNARGLAWTSIAVLAVGAIVGLLIVARVRRWLRSGRRTEDRPASKTERDAWDARIDDELRALD